MNNPHYVGGHILFTLIYTINWGSIIIIHLSVRLYFFVILDTIHRVSTIRDDFVGIVWGEKLWIAE